MQEVEQQAVARETAAEVRVQEAQEQAKQAVARAEVRVQEALEQVQKAEQLAIVAEKENVAHSKPSGMNEKKSTYINESERLITEQNLLSI